MRHTAIAEPYWSNRPVILVGGGPSLRGFNLARLADVDAWLVGINDSIFHLPRCDCDVTADSKYVGMRIERLKDKIAAGMEMVVALANPQQPIAATLVKRKLVGKLSDNPKEIWTCGTSGYAALNVAYLKRAKKILLLGYDYSPDGSHYFPDYDWHTPPKRADCWYFWAGFYASTRAQLNAAKIDVFNASPKSAITAFPRGTIEQGISWAFKEKVAA